MLGQIDHRGKCFTIDDDDVDNGRSDRYHRIDTLERQAQRELRELERAKAVAGPAGANLDVEGSIDDADEPDPQDVPEFDRALGIDDPIPDSEYGDQRYYPERGAVDGDQIPVDDLYESILSTVMVGTKSPYVA